MKRFLFALSVSASAAAVVASSSTASAQAPHWDVGIQLGVARRFLSDKTPVNSGDTTQPGPDATFGPIGEIRAHVALLPLVRVGAYLEHDISPVQGGSFGPARQITSGGLHIRLLSPEPRGKLRLYLGIGFGYGGVYAPSYTSATGGFDGNGNPVPNVFVQGSTGSFWEIPITLGLSYRIVKHLDFTAELGLRYAFLFGGDVYNGRIGTAANVPPLDVEFPGYDTFCPTLTVGALFDL